MIVRRRGWVPAVVLLAVFLMLGFPASADTISFSSGNDGFGSSYALSATCLGNVCDVTLITNNIGQIGYAYNDALGTLNASVAFSLASAAQVDNSKNKPPKPPKPPKTSEPASLALVLVGIFATALAFRRKRA